MQLGQAATRVSSAAPANEKETYPRCPPLPRQLEPTEAAEAAVEAITSAADKDATFSLELTQDQKDIRDWVHGFAADVMRPAAHEWDETRGDPVADHRGGGEDRPVRLRGLAQFFADPTGPDPADRQRGAVLGRRRHRHVDHGHRAGRGRDLRPGHGRADRRVDPALLRHAGRPQGRGLLRLRAQRRLGRLRVRTTRQVRRGRPTSGCSTARRRGPPTAASPMSTW